MRRRRRAGNAAAATIDVVRRWAADAVADFRFALRVLTRHKTFAIAAIATLALGIGATATVFATIDAVLLRPLPYRDPGALVRIWSANPRGIPRNDVSPPDYFDWREQARTFEDMLAFAPEDTAVGGAGGAVSFKGAAVTANAAVLLGVQPLLGRWFTAAEARRTTEDVVVISEGLWRERFASDPAILGRPLQIDGESSTVIGVMPERFAFPTAETRLWRPLPLAWRNQSRSARFLGVLGRLRDGVSERAAAADLAAAAGRLQQEFPQTNRGWGVTVLPLHESIAGGSRTSLLVVLAAVAALLLIACANVAGLMMARGVARQREFAVRTAIGAARGRLVRQQIVESAAFATFGGAAGLLVTIIACSTIRSSHAIGIPLLDRTVVDARAVVMLAAVSGVAAALAGLTTVLSGVVRFGTTTIAAGGRVTLGNIRVRRIVVGAQIAASTVLLAGGLLLVRTFEKLTSVDAGFDSRHTLLATVSLPGSRYPRDSRARFFDRAIESLRTLPGVEIAGAGGPLPLSGQDGLMRFGVSVEGRAPDSTAPDRAYLRWTAGDYFAAMGIPLRRGRALAASDTRDSPAVAVVDEALSARFFAGEDPVGRRIRLSNETSWRAIVGVVGSVRQTALDRDAEPHLYIPEAQLPSPTLALVLRGRGDPRSLVPLAREAIATLDPELPLSEVRTADDLVAGSVAGRRFNALVLGVFAVAALLLTLVGVYGVVAQSVAQSVKTMGIRLALGATAASVLREHVMRTAGFAAISTAAGTLMACAVAPLLRGLLFGVSPRDPVSLGLAAGILMLAALAAAYVPARQVLKLDVVNALRAD